ncbi:hypothetical protein DAMA08_037050 [Martiniozyma asiatica (nom. inval.)]|nr:hypothetical protein DAMA08_037050 [Martiniozyma asiatica]
MAIKIPIKLHHTSPQSNILLGLNQFCKYSLPIPAEMQIKPVKIFNCQDDKILLLLYFKDNINKSDIMKKTLKWINLSCLNERSPIPR